MKQTSLNLNALRGLVILLAFLIFMPFAAHANIITNGSFEDPIQKPGTWSTYQSILGWTATANNPLELRNAVSGTAQEGSNFIELDSYSNSSMSQVVSTAASMQYNLSYYYAPRQGVSKASNLIELYFNGNLIDSVTGYSNSGNAWELRSLLVTGNGSDLITFKAAGLSDSLGGSIDNVSMDPVPEPATLVMLGSGLIGLVGFGRKKLGK